MTALSSELELFALALLLYLYDSTVLLYANEAILRCERGDVWRVSTGWSGILVAGRKVCVLNPFTPYAACAKLRWVLGAPGGSTLSDESWSQELPKYKVASPWVLAAASALFVLLPLGLFTPLGLYATFPAVGVLYSSILIALVVMRRRNLQALPRLKFAGLIFECLACPPFGINLIRRVALQTRVNESLLRAGHRLLPPLEWTALRAHCVATLDQELLALEDGAPQRQALEAQRARLSDQASQP